MVSASSDRILRALIAASDDDWEQRRGTVLIEPYGRWDPDDRWLSELHPITMPHYFREILSRNNNLPEEISAADEGLESLLENKLVLDRKARVAGEGNEEDYFLCASIEYEDLPWDMEETDW